jgi:hypothetical protein
MHPHKKKIKSVQIRRTWMPDEWTPTANPCVQKTVVQPITYLGWKMGKDTIMLKSHDLMNIKG